MSNLVFIAERELNQLPQDAISINENIFVPYIDFYNYGFPNDNCVVWFKSNEKYYVFKLDGDFDETQENADLETQLMNAVSRLL